MNFQRIGRLVKMQQVFETWRMEILSIRQSIPPESKTSPFLQPPDDPCLLHFYFELAAFNENNNDGRQTVTQNRSVPIHFSNLSHCPRKSTRFYISRLISFSSSMRFSNFFRRCNYRYVYVIRVDGELFTIKKKILSISIIKIIISWYVQGFFYVIAANYRS